MKAVYSNLGGGAYFHLFLVLTNVQYALISLTPFVYPTHPGPLIVPDGTTAHKSSNMKIAHTEEVHLFLEVTGFEQALVRQIVATVKEEYLADICNHTTKSISDTVEDVLTHLQEKHSQLMIHKILGRKDIVKKMTYHSQEPIATVLFTVKEFLGFDYITGKLYTQLQAMNILYVIIHRTGKFELAVNEWNHMTKVQKT